MAMVALAMILGGGGTTNPQTEMVLQVLIFLLMIPLVMSNRWQRGMGSVSGAAWLLGALFLVLPVVQLVPLPASIWQALPGRAIEAQSLAVADAARNWMPLSIAPARTFASLLAMICPMLIMLQVSRLSLRGRSWLCATIVAIAAASIILGVLQLSHTGGLDWSLYAQFSEGYLVGFQANRNAEADVLLIAMLAFSTLIAIRLGDGRFHAMTWIALPLGLIPLLIGVFMTGSRTGIGLTALALCAITVMVWPAMQPTRKTLAVLGGGLAGVVIFAVSLAQLQSVRKVIDRFSITNDTRWELWTDASFAIKQVWPIGSGIGTVVPMLEAAERLDVVDASRPVRVHNDWLEWVLETGVPGMLVLGVIAGILALLIVRAFVACRKSGAEAARFAQVTFATGLLVILALHSIVDYPLRSMALAILTAVAVGFLTEPAAPQRNSR